MEYAFINYSINLENIDGVKNHLSNVEGIHEATQKVNELFPSGFWINPIIKILSTGNEIFLSAIVK